jgi:hypothetical protein
MKIQIPENIDLRHSERYILTIRIHPERFSFSLYNPIDDSSYFYYPIEKDKQSSAFSSFQDDFFDNEFFSLPYRKVNIINYTDVFTYIPALIFEEKDKATYMKFLFTENENKILHHEIKNQGITILHEMKEEIYEFFQRSFVNGQIIHHTASLIAYFWDKTPTVNRNKLIVNLQDNGLDILCFSHEHFLLGNHFDCRQIEDAVYYILFVWKQLKFDQLKDFAYITGDVASKKDLMEQLKAYIYNIIPINIIPEAHFSQIDTQIIPFEMACLSLCEL